MFDDKNKENNLNINNSNENNNSCDNSDYAESCGFKVHGDDSGCTSCQ